ncbi:MAG: hypothetical protein E7521_04220 [Ruminococcaceae bacterium]|nr:hypothetical protein [Oscillospiraceae bacterium]
MKKLKMKLTKSITFKEGCDKYLDYCRQRNLRQGTINHYRQLLRLESVTSIGIELPDIPFDEDEE